MKTQKQIEKIYQNGEIVAWSNTGSILRSCTYLISHRGKYFVLHQEEEGVTGEVYEWDQCDEYDTLSDAWHSQLYWGDYAEKWDNALCML